MTVGMARKVITDPVEYMSQQAVKSIQRQSQL